MKRYRNKMISWVIILCLLLTNGWLNDLSVDAAAHLSFEDEAEKLHAMGLFQGTGSGFALDRAPTRAEAIVMLVRLLGKEEEAEATLSNVQQHPFEDVPNWANPHVTYAYNHGLTTGMSATRFGSAENATMAQYNTFLLRALGYDDSAGDFHWQESTQKLIDLGMTTKQRYNDDPDVFLRGHVVDLSYHALVMTMKNEEITLLDKLVADGAVVLEAIETNETEETEETEESKETNETSEPAEEELADDLIIRTENSVILPVTVTVNEQFKGYHIEIQSEHIKLAFPSAYKRTAEFGGWSDLSIEDHIEMALLKGWGPMESLFSHEIDDGMQYFQQFTASNDDTSINILHDESGEPIAYTNEHFVSIDLAQITFYTTPPQHLLERIAEAKAISERAHYISHDDLYITYGETYSDGEWIIDESRKVVKIDEERLPEHARNFTRSTQRAYPFNDDGSPYAVKNIGNITHLTQKMQQFVFADVLDDGHHTFPVGPRYSFNLGEYSGQWSLLFQFFLNDNYEIVAYTYFTDDDYKSWAERVQNWEGHSLE